MTEEDWLSSGEPLAMFLEVKSRHLSSRKMRLWNVAIFRRYWLLLPEESQEILTESERLADGWSTATPDELCGRANAVVAPFDRRYPNKQFPSPETCNRRNAAAAACYAVLEDTWGASSYLTEIDTNDSRPQADLLRDIFGNPFRPVTFDPAWRTSTALALAKQMYDSRDFGAMPILADALQDAGCDHEDILTHCRGDGPHVRGCWVVDLVLGKT